MFKVNYSKFLGHDSPVNPVNEARLDMLFKQTQAMGFLSIVLSGLLALLMTDSGRGQGMSIWVSLIGFLFIIRWLFFYRIIYRLRKQGVHRFHLYHSVIILFTLMSGVLWGTGVYLFLPYIDQVELFITFITVLVGITAGNMPSFAPSFIAYLSFMIPTLTGTALKAYEFEYTVLSVVIIIYMSYLTLTCWRMSKAVIKTISINIENEQLLSQVRVEKDKAEKANIQKSKFLAAASHDLRQPLNSMGLFMYAYGQSLASSTTPSISHNRKLFGKIQQSYEALKELFDALLEVSRLDADNVELSIESISITSTIQPIIDELSDQAQAKDIDLIYEGSQHYVETDRILLSRIIRNLLDNALKYTERGKIEIKTQELGGLLRLSVIDSGVGIPDSELQNIFDEYHQLANKRRDRRQGIGLGLAIVKKMASLLGFSIEVSSEVGKGSTFSFSLKITKPAATKNGNRYLLEETDEVEVNKSILVIDDDPDILEGMELLLSNWGFSTTMAENYEQAKLSLQQSEPDLILCDYRLQDNMNGIQVLLKLATTLPRPVEGIIISGDTDPVVLEHITGNGFVCLSKPIDPKQLQLTLYKILNV